MKKIYLLYTLFALSTIHAQIDQNLNKTSGLVLTPITQIDSIRFGNSQTMQVVLRDGSIINHSIFDINNVTFSMPSYPGGAGNCSGYPTAVVEVVNPVTGKKWMDRNLGASRVATNINDDLAYGDLYQWGRGTDGHQCRSSMAYAPSSSQNTNTDNPTFYIGNIWISGLFVIPQPWLTDWRNPKNDGLWQGQFSATSGSANNPCPITYRLPTASELDAERLSWTSNNSIGAFNSPLKFTASGRKIGTQGTQPLPYFNGVGSIGAYWTSTIDNNNSRLLYFDSSNANVTSGQRANGLSVRCIKARGSLNALWCNFGGGLVTHLGNLTQGFVANDVITKTTVRIGNYGSYDSLSVPSTGITGLTANLAAGDFSIGTFAQLTFIISGTPNGYGIANFTVTIDGQTCSFSRTVDQGVVSSLNCNSATISTNLTKDIAISNSSFLIPYTGGNGGYYYGKTVQSTGVTGITATLAAGNLSNGNGTLTYTLSGTPSSAGTANFLINFGGLSCVISCPVYPNPGSISNLNCSGTNSTGALTIGMPATNVNLIIPYSGGDGGFYSSLTINSTGVTGLTASLTSGNFNVGSGNLTYNVSGTPTSSGMANFTVNIGGQTCVLSRIVNSNLIYPNGTVFCSFTPTAIVDVTNPTTGKIWMDRNLGATQVATSSTDANSYGDLYQWGRRSDGHQCRTSTTTTILSSTDQPTHGNFIRTTGNDWRSPQNNNLWQGINGINNPCPTGYRLPTSAELDSERLSWDYFGAQGAFESFLKLPLSGSRLTNGVFSGTDGQGYYWSSTISGSQSTFLYFNSGNIIVQNSIRASGYSIRCIKN